MQYLKYIAALGSFALAAVPVMAAVSVTQAPTSLVTSTVSVEASSDEVALFSFALTEDADETLESVSVTVNTTGGSTTSSDDLHHLSLYQDDGDGTFEEDQDTELDNETNVNVGSATVLSAGDAALDGTKFFVALATDGSWAEGDKVTVTLGANSIVTSENSPVVTAVTTAVISGDNSGPELTSALAGMIGDAKVVVLTFDEATNKATINDSNIDDELALNNAHTWLDGEGDITSATWNTDGTKLTVTLDDEDPDPTVAVGDTVTITGDVIEDALGNEAMGAESITGDFATEIEEEDAEEEPDEEIGNCTNGLRNGRLYKTSDNDTVYLAAACRLKPFRGAAAFHARGHKFQNIIVLNSLTNITVDKKPALPAGGTIVKGSDATVFIVTKNGKRKGFTSANAFTRLGFKFNQVQQISDSDLATMLTDTPVTENDNHPEGTVAKCGNSSTVFEIKNNTRFPFTSVEAFELRGHSFTHIAVIDCGRFAYLQGTNQTETE